MFFRRFFRAQNRKRNVVTRARGFGWGGEEDEQRRAAATGSAASTIAAAVQLFFIYKHDYATTTTTAHDMRVVAEGSRPYERRRTIRTIIITS